MDLLVLDSNFKFLEVLDTFQSLIWTDRYFECGDFEIYMALDLDKLSFLRDDNYLSLVSSEHTMVIEELQIVSDVETGPVLLIKGRSLESILDRRIVWKQTIFNGNLQSEIHRLLDENVINPTDAARKINNLVFEDSTDINITSLTLTGQYTGEFIYDVIRAICIEKNIGFKIVWTELGGMVFSLYSGEDRSYSQDANPYVVFSPEFDNLINTDSVYLESKTKLKTTILVMGEGEGAARLTETASISTGAGTDLVRREMFTDAGDISKTTDDVPLTDAQYKIQLAQRGMEKLSENTFVNTFDGQIESTGMYAYGSDFFMGDIVQVVNEYQLEGTVQVIELIQSQNESGINIYPTFRNIT